MQWMSRYKAVFLFLIILTHFSITGKAQGLGTIKGYVTDTNGVALVNATIFIDEARKGANTDLNGFFLIKLRPGDYTMVVSYAGVPAQRRQVKLKDGETVDLQLKMQTVLQMGEIVVLGSRNKEGRTRLNTMVPVDNFIVSSLRPFAQADVGQMLTMAAPSFQSARQTISDGTDHIDPASLRGLGPDQVLVLVNGKRYHTSALVNINGTVGRGSVGTDLNTIPAAAIERIEVLRDGASAQYGSDAIAGVINVVLKKNVKRFSLSTMTGQHITDMPYAGSVSLRDGMNNQFDFSGGWTDKKGGFLTISGQWLRREATNRSGLDNIPLIYYGNGGALPPLNALPAGVLPVDYYRWLMDMDRATVQTRGYDRRNLVAGNAASSNLSVFMSGATHFGKKVEAYFTVGISDRQGRASGNSRNPNSWSQQPVLSNGQRYYYDGFLPQIVTGIGDHHIVIGLSRNLGKWRADLSNTIGKNGIRLNVENSGNASLPAKDNIQTSFAAGKLVFLQHSWNLDLQRTMILPGKASLQLSLGTEFRKERFRIYEGEANSYKNGGRLISPEPIPPYPGTAAYLMYPSGNAVSGAQVYPGFQPGDAISAYRNISSVYSDLEYRKDKWMLGAAVRYEYYDELSENQSNLAGKFAGRYDWTSFLAIRGSLSTGFRAPSLHQRYFQNTSTQFVGGLPSQALTANNGNAIVNNAFGIASLKPEVSRNATFGIVGALNANITYSVDAYLISIRDRIVLSSQFNRSNPLIQSIFTANGVDPSINALQFWTNAVNTKTRGIDVVLTNKFAWAGGRMTLSLAGNFNRNRVDGGIQTNSVIDDPANNPSATDPSSNPANDLANALFDRQQRSRIEVAQPQSKVNIQVTYDRRKWSFLLRTVRFGSITLLNNVDPLAVNAATGQYWNDIAPGSDQTFSAKWTTDLVVTYRLSPFTSLSFGAANVFDVYPDRIFIDGRNDPSAYYNAPVSTSLGVSKTVGGYNASRDLSNRGRYLFPVNQFGMNGRFLFLRALVDLSGQSR